jgi:2-methylcitrate dehydratase PrpD
MAARISSDPNPAKLVGGFGERWAVLETSFKFHASCRHTHPAADALLQAMQEHHLSADRVAHVRAHVHQPAIDVLGPVTDPQTIHQSKFSMGFVLALIALHGSAGVTEFTDETLRDPEIRGFADRVEMVYDSEIDAAYPERWIGLVEVETSDGEHFTSRVDVPRGDPENTLSRGELEDKARRLSGFQDGASPEEIRRIIDRVWALSQEPGVRDLLPRV